MYSFPFLRVVFTVYCASQGDRSTFPQNHARHPVRVTGVKVQYAQTVFNEREIFDFMDVRHQETSLYTKILGEPFDIQRQGHFFVMIVTRDAIEGVIRP